MTDDKLLHANNVQQAIFSIENQLAYADKIDLLPACHHSCDKSLHEWAVPLDKKIRTYLKTTLSQELNKLKKEFDKL